MNTTSCCFVVAISYVVFMEGGERGVVEECREGGGKLIRKIIVHTRSITSRTNHICDINAIVTIMYMLICAPFVLKMVINSESRKSRSRLSSPSRITYMYNLFPPPYNGVLPYSAHHIHG